MKSEYYIENEKKNELFSYIVLILYAVLIITNSALSVEIFCQRF